MGSLKVLIAGGGIGGLALAHGLVRRGMTVRLFERAPHGGAAGYRLHMNGDGGTALEALLPPELFELYLDTSRTDPRQERLLILDKQLRYLASRPHLGVATSGRRKDTAVNRRTLRQIMLSGLEDVVVTGEVASYEDRGQEVEVVLSDGQRETGDVLVGFDGIHSRVRAQRLPDAQVKDLGALGVYGRVPLTDELRDSLPPELDDGFVLAFGPQLLENGVLALGAFTPRVQVSQAATLRGVELALDEVAPYMMLGAAIPEAIAKTLGLDPARPNTQILKRAIQELVRGWHPAIIELVERAPAEDLFLTRARYLDVSHPWEPSRVTLAGDAIHAMPPSLGVGANLALRDAHVLADALESISTNESSVVIDAIGRYEKAMRGYAFPLLRRAITQEGIASGFSPMGLYRLVRMVGLRKIVRASRARNETVGTTTTSAEGK